MNKKLVSSIEAILVASDRKLTAKEISDILGADVTVSDVVNGIEELNTFYRETERSFCIKKIANGYKFFILPEFSACIKKLYSIYKQEKLSRASIETLAIIAYRQPITKLEIEQIRGVSCEGVIKTLCEKGLVKISGRKEVPGRPFLYITTDQFLDYFGLESLNDLPKLEDVDYMLGGVPEQEVNLGVGEVKVGDRKDRSEYSKVS